MSSISLARRPIRKGARYSSTASATALERWVKVAQPTPVRPGIEVSIFTMTSRAPYGAVLMARTAVIYVQSAAAGGGRGSSQQEEAASSQHAHTREREEREPGHEPRTYRRIVRVLRADWLRCR